MTPLQKTLFDQLKDKSLFEAAKSSAYEYFDHQFTCPLVPTPDTQQLLEAFDHPLNESSTDAMTVINQLNEIGAPNAVSYSGRYFGFVNGGALPVTTAARWLADSWDQNAALQVMSPVAATLEQVTEDWLKSLLGLPEKTVAGLVGGTSVATLCGLAAARFRQLSNLGWDIEQQGLMQAPPLRIIMGDQTHGTVSKMLHLLGFGDQQIEWIESDDQGRMRVDALPQLDASCILILQAGNVNSGAFDHFEVLCTAARSAGAWVHLDGAFGLWAAASPQLKHLTAGAELAHSWSVDGHKTLNTPYDCGVILCADETALVSALHQQGSYIQHSDARDSMIYTPDMSRRARGIDLWAALKFLGRSGVAQLIEQFHDYAQQFAAQLKDAGFEVLNQIHFNQVLLHIGDKAKTTAFLQQVQMSGECWCGGTNWFGQPAVRISVCAWSTTEEDIARSISLFKKVRKKLEAASK